MTTDDALNMAIDALNEKRQGFALAVRMTKEQPKTLIPSITRKQRLRYEQLTAAIEQLSKLRKELKQ